MMGFEKVIERLEFNHIRQLLADQAISDSAKRACLTLQPECYADEVDLRLKETEAAYSVLQEKGEAPFRGLRDLSPLFQRLRLEASLNIAELLSVTHFLQAVERLRQFAPSDRAQENKFYYHCSLLRPFPSLTKRLYEAIQSEDSLYDHASPELARLRQGQKHLHRQIRETLERLLNQASDFLQEQLVTQRSGRYVLPVKAEHKGKLSGVVHDSSSSGATLFVEPMAVVQANNQLRELEILERDEIARILTEFSDDLRVILDELQWNLACMTNLDVQMAKAKLAHRLEGIMPKMNTEGRIKLPKARHPLIPPQQVVPIDLELGLNYQTLVITGPNTGGKTVALKTLGLLTLMAQSGLFVPAHPETELAIFEQVLVDIGDEQSIEQSLSTFSAHMSHLVEICQSVHHKSLVLVDELGSGTDPKEGAALAIALLDHFRAMGARTLATTHYQELKRYALETSGVENASCEFDTEALRPTYRLLLGVPGVSHAFAISEKLGLPSELIDFARRQMSEKEQTFERLIQDLDREKRNYQDKVQALELDAQRLDRQLKEVNQLEERLLSEKKTLKSTYREEARAELSAYLELVDEYVTSIKSKLEQGALGEAGQLAQEVRRDLRQEKRRLEEAIGRDTLRPKKTEKQKTLTAEDIQIGESYYAAHLSMEGKAMSLVDAKGQVLLQSGAMKVRVPLASLERATSCSKREEKRVAKMKSSTSLRQAKRQQFSPEIRLLGQTGDEALANLDQFLDDAVLASVHQLRVVHGKGTGVLRRVVAEHLKRDRRVKSYRLAAYGEGDSGVTIVELR